MAGKLRTALGILFVGALLGNAACTGDTGPAGPPGKQGPKGDPGAGGSGGGAAGSESISAVLPGNAFLGRTVDVTIIGSNTNWDDSIKSKVNFGAGITVKGVSVPSPTSIVATIEIGATATQGLRDVSVDTDTYKQAFSIDPPLAVVGSNKVPQGGISVVHLDMLDPTTPFDPDPTNITVSSSNAGVNVIAAAASGRGYDFQVFGDVKATGDADLVVTSGMGSAAVDSPISKGVTVQARAATALVSGTPADDNLPDGTTTLLYSAASPSANLTFLEVILVSADGGGPVAAVLPKSGKFVDELGEIGSAGLGGIWGSATTSTDPLYFVTLDGGGFFSAPPPYGITYTATAVQGTSFTETANNNAAVLADALTALPAIVPNADLLNTDMSLDDDWFKFTLTTETTIHVATGGNGLADSVVEVYDVDGTTVLGTSDDHDYHEDLVVSGISAPGTYFVHVFASSFFDGDPAHSKYDLLVEAN